MPAKRCAARLVRTENAPMEPLLNIANLLYLAAYFVRDVLWLRLLSFVGASCLMLYFYAQPQPFMQVVYWNLAFAGLNLYWIARLALERSPWTRGVLARAGDGFGTSGR